MIAEGQNVEVIRGWGLYMMGTVAKVFPREAGESPDGPRRIRVVFPGDIRPFRDVSDADVRILPD